MNVRRFSQRVLCTAVALAALIPSAASAGFIMHLSEAYNGATPLGAGPWARATFDDFGPNSVKLTMENLATGSATQCITNWTFNIADDDFLTGLGFTYLGTVLDSCEARSIDIDAGRIKAAGGGALGFGFDIGLNFERPNGGGPASSNRFTPGETCVYQLTYTGSKPGFGASLFNAMTDNGLLTSAHIQGIPSGSQTTSGAVTVPEPSSLVLWSLLGAAGLGMSLAARRRRVDHNGSADRTASHP